MKPKRGRPPKPESKQKSRYLQVRVSDGEKQVFDKAAELAGQDLSVWVRDRLRRIARTELTEAGEKFDLGLLK